MKVYEKLPGWVREAPPVMTVSEAARVLGVAEKTLRRAIEAGELQAMRVGRGAERAHWRVTQDQLVEYVERRSHEK